MTDTSSNVQKLIGEVLARRESVDHLAQKIRTPEILAKFDKRNARSWCVAVAGDVLIRVRLFIEQNFKVVETVGVIAVARYLLELNVWMSLFRSTKTTDWSISLNCWTRSAASTPIPSHKSNEK